MAFFCIGLHGPRNAINIGAALRGATAFGAAMVAISGSRFKKSATDTTNAHRDFPVLNVLDLRSVIPYGCVPVAVDLVDDAESLVGYEHPRNAFYVFGPEDGTLGESVTCWCRDRIYIPTSVCLNLAAAVNVVIYDRVAKNER